jgi:putative DNA primase/helicase
MFIAKENREVNTEGNSWDADDIPFDLPAETVNKLVDKLTNKKDQSTELNYVKYIKSNPNLRIAENGEFTIAYEWKGSHWGKMTDAQFQRKAWDWLKMNEPKRATATMARSLHASSLLELPILPKAPECTVIPLQDKWLVVEEDGQFRVMEPNRDWGVTYEINAHSHMGQNFGNYEPKDLAEDSWFSRFLKVSLPNLEERALVQEYCGYTLLNDVRFQVAQVWVGNGRNGKSVLLKIMEKLHSKVGSISLDNLSGFGLTPIMDASLVISSETPKRGIDEQALKQIISGDPVTVEFKFKDAFTYSPTAKLLIACNRFPHMTDDSNGIWRRLQIINWGVNLTDEQEVPNIDKKIIDGEIKLVLDWCLQGLSRLLRRGAFNLPQSTQIRKEDEKMNSNNILAFIDDYGLDVSSVGASTYKHRIYEKYEEYCQSNGLSAFRGNEFWKRMTQKFPTMQAKRKPDSSGNRLRAVNLTFGNHPVINVLGGKNHV